MESLFSAFGGNASLLDPDGLAANRVGEITEAQNKRLFASPVSFSNCRQVGHCLQRLVRRRPRAAIL